MNTFSKILAVCFIFLLFSCKNSAVLVSLKDNSMPLKEISKIENDTVFLNLRDFSNDFVFDMKYASNDNFLHKQVYPCQVCFLRAKTIKALIEANTKLIAKGFRIKIFDCYRPLDIQKKMWKIMPDPNFVANPKKGSIHNRGGAVDITLVDFSGKELDMGTNFDYFGEQASHLYINFKQEILDNRRLLKEIMLDSKFNSFDSEWWHYNLSNGLTDKVSNFKWRCN